MRDFGLTTGVAGGGTAIDITATDNSELVPVSTIANVSIHGADGFSGTDYWNTGIYTHNATNMNYIGVLISGAGTPTFHGDGFHFIGTDTSHRNDVHNLIGTQVICVDRAVIIDSWVEGVTVSGGSNFVCGNTGILVPATSAFGDQLTVIGNSFNQTGASIDIEGPISIAQIDNNVFIPGNGVTANAIGILMNYNSQFTMTHNNFQGGAPTSTGIKVSNGSGLIQGNTFSYITNGINLTSGSEQVRVTDDQMYSSVTTPVLNSGTGNQVDGATAFTPTVFGATTAGSPTYTAQTGVLNRTRAAMNLTFQVSLSSLSGMAGAVKVQTPLVRSGTGPVLTCSLTPIGFTFPSPYTMATGLIQQSSATVDLYYSNSATGGSIPVDASTLAPASFQLYGQCAGVL